MNKNELNILLDELIKTSMNAQKENDLSVIKALKYKFKESQDHLDNSDLLIVYVNALKNGIIKGFEK